MRFRLRRLAVSSLLFIAACSADSPSKPGDPGDPGKPGDPGQPGNPGDPGQPAPVTIDQLATNLGVSIMARNEKGVPRLIRAIVPRAGLSGATAELTARDHIAALSKLRVQGSSTMALVETGTQQLRNGATVVQLAQQVDGVPVDQGELRVLLHASGAFAAVSGTLLPATSAPAFVSSAQAALGHALDHQFGA